MSDIDYKLFEELVDSEYHMIPVLSFIDPVDYLLGSGSCSVMSRAKHWCFTLNNYTEEDEVRILDLESEVDYICFGREVGASGTPHLQGFISFRTRVRRNTAVERVGQAHFSVARNLDQAIEYCKKDGDFVEVGIRPRNAGNRSDLEDFKNAVVGGEYNMAVLRKNYSDVVAKYPKFCVDFVQDNLPKKQVEAYPLKDWQQVLYHDLRLEADNRKIIFVVDTVGNTGKSWFCHYYCSLHEDSQVLLPGKKQDMSYSLNPMIRVLFIDAPRSKQGEYIQYDFLEDVKNGYVFSPKYESRLKYLGNVHVVVMMNEDPDLLKLSVDRYDIRRI